MTEFVPRWEKIFGLHPAATDSLAARRTQIARKWLLIGLGPYPQPTYDRLKQLCPNTFQSIANTPSSSAATHIAGGATIPGGITVAAEPIDPVTNTQLITWASSVAHVAFLMSKPAWMTEADFYKEADSIYQYLDDWLPAWATYAWVRDGSVVGKFILDDAHNLDNERFFAGPGTYVAPTIDFSRVNGAGWAGSAELTAAQLNQLDIDHQATLNRMGGNIVGTVGVTSNAGVLSTQGSTQWKAVSTSTWQSGSTFNIQTGTNLTIAAAQSWNGVASLAGGSTHLMRGTLKTTAGGRLVLGDSDYPTFSANRERLVSIDLASLPIVFGTGWTQGADGIIGPGTVNAATIPLGPKWLHNGARLVSAKLYFTSPAGSPHTSTPTNGVTLGITSRVVVDGAPLPARTLVSVGTSYSGTLAQYNAPGVKTLLHGPASPPTINNATTEYALQLTDENGGGFVVGNVFHKVLLKFDLISDMRFE